MNYLCVHSKITASSLHCGDRHGPGSNHQGKVRLIQDSNHGLHTGLYLTCAGGALEMAFRHESKVIERKMYRARCNSQ
jgi:hypothetical protein